MVVVGIVIINIRFRHEHMKATKPRGPTKVDKVIVVRHGK